MNLRTFAILLLVIGLIASFYSPLLLYRITVRAYDDTSSPYCMNWMGTSLLVKILEDKGFRVIIADSPREFIEEVMRGGLILLIAPNKGFTNETAIIVELLERGIVNLAVFDENTTLNSLLEHLGVRIIGKAVLDPFNPTTPYYPLASIKAINGTSYFYRLNWGSVLNYTIIKNYNYTVISVAFGVLDINDNGLLDDIAIGTYNIGLLITSGHSEVLVLGDSFPLLNTAIIKNLTITKIMLDYIGLLAKNNRIIIPNYLYTPKSISQIVPFHVVVLYALAVEYLKKIDGFINTHVLQNPYLSLALLASVVIVLAGIMRYILGLTSFAEYSFSKQYEYRLLVKSLITENLLDKRILKGREKELVKTFWNILVVFYRRVLGLDLNEILSSRREELLIRLGYTAKELKRMRWAYSMYLKASENTLLPIVLSWRRALLKFIENIELFLNKHGYTLMSRSGFRDVYRVLK
ncbi:MAG: DUF4350 domain-containing protein [Thermoprotei archaeon]